MGLETLADDATAAMKSASVEEYGAKQSAEGARVAKGSSAEGAIFEVGTSDEDASDQNVWETLQ